MQYCVWDVGQSSMIVETYWQYLVSATYRPILSTLEVAKEQGSWCLASQLGTSLSKRLKINLTNCLEGYSSPRFLTSGFRNCIWLCFVLDKHNLEQPANNDS